MTDTAVVSIGNSDDKLSQVQWAGFQRETNHAVQTHSLEVHARTVALPTDPWQNAVWVFEVDETIRPYLIDRLKQLAKHYRQDSIALTLGTTQLVAP